MVTWENYEEYMMLHTDGELQPEETATLMAFVAQHPELQQELAAFSAAHLVPDSAITYPATSQLIQPDGGKRIAFPFWTRYSIAAGVALLVGAALFRSAQPQPAQPSVAHGQNVVAPKLLATPTITPPAVAANPTQPQPPITHTSPAHTTQYPVAAARPTQDHHSKAPAVVAPQEAQLTATTVQIDPLPVAAAYVLAAPAWQQATAPEGADMAMPTATSTPTRRSILDILPLEDIKKQGMEDAALAVAKTYQQANDLKNDLLNKSISIHFEKRKLIVSF